MNSLIDELPTIIDYTPSVTVKSKNVYDFQKLLTHYWNNSTRTKKQNLLFDKLCIWNNIWISRKEGYHWCSRCKDTGEVSTWKGKFTCSCPADGYREHMTIEMSEEGKRYEAVLQSFPKKCFVCSSDHPNLISGMNYFYYVCDSPECQEEINKNDRLKIVIGNDLESIK